MKLLNVIIITMSFIIISCTGDKLEVTPTEIVSPTSQTFEPALKRADKGLYKGNFAKRLLSNKVLKLIQVFGTESKIEIPECSKDDELTLLDDGIFTYQVNTPCVETDKNGTGTWEIEEDNGKIYLLLDHDEKGMSVAEIISIEKNLLKITNVEDQLGDIAVLTISEIDENSSLETDNDVDKFIETVSGKRLRFISSRNHEGKLPPCQSDNELFLHADGKMELKINTRCEDEEGAEGTWYVQKIDGKLKLFFYSDGDGDDYVVVHSYNENRVETVLIYDEEAYDNPEIEEEDDTSYINLYQMWEISNI